VRTPTFDSSSDHLACLATEHELSIDSVHPPAAAAAAAQVDIGAMQVDYSALVWQQKVRMRNVPTGRVRIHLSGRDMGNFVSHPLFQAAAATAIHVSWLNLKGRVHSW
jgi:hypothetical protein